MVEVAAGVAGDQQRVAGGIRRRTGARCLSQEVRGVETMGRRPSRWYSLVASAATVGRQGA